MERRKGKVSILISGVKLFGLIWEFGSEVDDLKDL